MRLNLGPGDDWIVDPDELSTRFGVCAGNLRRLKVMQQVECVMEPKDPNAPDETRVKVRVLDQVWRGIFDKGGNLVLEELY